jgi:hypothetical protein
VFVDNQYLQKGTPFAAGFSYTAILPLTISGPTELTQSLFVQTGGFGTGSTYWYSTTGQSWRSPNNDDFLVSVCPAIGDLLIADAATNGAGQIVVVGGNTLAFVDLLSGQPCTVFQDTHSTTFTNVRYNGTEFVAGGNNATEAISAVFNTTSKEWTLLGFDYTGLDTISAYYFGCLYGDSRGWVAGVNEDSKAAPNTHIMWLKNGVWTLANTLYSATVFDIVGTPS